MLDLIAQIAGWVALPLALARPHLQTVDRMLWCSALAAVFAALNIAVLGEPGGAIISTAVAFSAGFQAALGSSIQPLLRYIVAMGAVLLAFIFREEGLWSLLPITAFIIARIAEASRNPLLVRTYVLPASSLWVAYGIAMGLPAVAALNALSITSTVLALWMMRSSSR
jgi:hypothetical protein